ncbi:NAD(P)H-hydrate dehydratase, partial [Chitinibacter sp. ZOR0017]|uniref:NAD(P)H-hydrate dehydratase n=1 Tax=Chitinibacter sp. ZOR0017 TaxID=1339254 RepID=UPI0006480D6E
MNESDPIGGALARLQRAADSHKGSFGSIAILGGAPGMVGAALLAGRAALHMGAGKVWLGLLDPRPYCDWQQPELMLGSTAHALAQPYTHLACGMGMGISPQSAELLGLALNTPTPLLLDADALNLLASQAHLRAQLQARWAQATVLTPHPAEAARLLACTTAEVQADRVQAVQTLARELGCTVLLKGHGTLIADPDGQISRNLTGNPALSSAGQGDTLAGMIIALAAQGLTLAEAARAGAYLHGAAADRWREQHPAGIGLTASETSLIARQILNEDVIKNSSNGNT